MALVNWQVMVDKEKQMIKRVYINLFFLGGGYFWRYSKK